MRSLKWFVSAIATLGLSVVTVMIAMELLPTGEVAYTKGTYVPWVLTWIMIWGTVLAGVMVAGFMVGWATGRIRSEH